jgi:hypothetical protein
MATNIGSLAPGMDGRGVRLGIGRNFFQVHAQSIVESRCQVTNKRIPILCPYPSDIATNAFTPLDRLCPSLFVWFLKQFSHSHYNSLPLTQ